MPISKLTMDKLLFSGGIALLCVAYAGGAVWTPILAGLAAVSVWPDNGEA